MKKYMLSEFKTLLESEGLLIESELVCPNCIVEYITYDSRLVRNNTLFACKGAAFTESYLANAVESGAICYISEKKYNVGNVSCFIVSDVRRAMAKLAGFYHDYAYKKLNLIGITGTKGKTTTAYYIKYILDDFLQARGEKPSAILSSIEVYDGKEHHEAHLTTPEAFELHKHFDNAVSSGISFFEMEVSSQALKYDRVLDVCFDVGVFLNFSEDHISPTEHSDIEDYLTSKLRLFSQSRVSIVNASTALAYRVLEAAKKCTSGKVITFSTMQSADVFGYNIHKHKKETRFNVRTQEFDEEFAITMPGFFNVENALAAIAICLQYSIPLENIKSGLYKARSSGRMEFFTCENTSVTAIVDYAHNRMSFEKLFQSINEEFPHRPIISVFGCPGGKAFNRREELGEVASRYSRQIYLTADQPNFEPVEDTCNEIAKHINNCSYVIVKDRIEAIERAIKEAPNRSIVVIAGKGCEASQYINGEYIPYKTDAYYAKKFLEEKSDIAISQPKQ